MKETQSSVHTWTQDIFPQYATVPKRCIALVEEATELAIACGVSIENILAAVSVPCKKYQASHDSGSILEEIGDVQLCLYSLAGEAGINAQAALDTKMQENRQRPRSFFDKKHKVKKALGLQGV